MIDAAHSSDLELAVLHTSLVTDFTEAGRAAGLQGARLVVSHAGSAVWAGDSMPGAVAASLAEVEAEPAPDDLSQPAQLKAICRRLEEWRSPVHVEGGPVYVFTAIPVVRHPVPVTLVTSNDGDQGELSQARPSSWEAEEWSRLLAGQLGPWALAVDDGAVVSCCHTPTPVTPQAAECGVWTDPRHRGRGLAAATTAAWAALLASPSRHLFYSTDADNGSSQRVPTKLGLRRIAWDWTVFAGEWREDDAWGRALLDQHVGRYVPRLELETDAGEVTAAMRPEWFFRGFDDWDWWDRELLTPITAGPVLDLGAGAGRASLWLQERGIEVTAVEASPLAARVCRLRGVRDVRVGDLNNPPADRPWSAFLLLCGNLGLGGSRQGIRQLLSRLAAIAAPDAVLIGDTVDPGRHSQTRLRIRYQGEATPWWPQYNIPIAEVPAVVEGTGWRLERHLVDGSDHAIMLRLIDAA